jgi:hypothetical protein
MGEEWVWMVEQESTTFRDCAVWRELEPGTTLSAAIRSGTLVSGGSCLFRERLMNQSQPLACALIALSVACTAGALVPTSARADGSVSALGMGMGARPGQMGRFDAVVQQYNASGERFRIDGHCQSACTIFLSIRNVCITPGATLLFHSGGDPKANKVNPASTQHMLSAYNSALRQYVSANHFMDTFAFHAISGREMAARFGYPACPK